MRALGALIRRDIRIALRVSGGALIGVLLFVTVVVLMPFTLGPNLALLARLGPAIVWLGALLASLLLAASTKQMNMPWMCRLKESAPCACAIAISR